MILTSLVRLAERELPQDQRGLTEMKVHWIIDIDLAGKVLGVTSTAQRNPGEKKDEYLRLVVPMRRTDRNGLKIVADLLVDNAFYLFGLGDAKKEFKAARAQEAVRVSLDALSAMQTVAPEVAAQIAAQRAVVADLPAFARIWSGTDATQQVPSVAGEIAVPKAWASNHLFAFRVVDGPFVVSVPAVKTWISCQACAAATVDHDDDANDLCLVTGRWSVPMRLFSGVNLPGDTGTVKLVSFNARAFEHYGRENNANAPVSVDAADAVFAALQHLLTSGNRSKSLTKKTTVLFWADAPATEDRIDDLLGPCLDADPAAVRRVEMIYAAPQDGRALPGKLDMTPFCSLVLTREKARVTVRSAMLTTVGEVAQAIRRWFADLEVAGAGDRPYRALWALAKATVSDKSKDGEAVHELIARFYLAAITGVPLPTEAMAAVLRRIRAHDDAADSPSRIALIKATLIRSYHLEIPVSLDPAYPDPAYHLGRLFAVLEQIQDKAINANAGIAERYLGAAMGTPALVFPRLLKLHHHHLAKIGGGLEVVLGKQIDGIMARLPPTLPNTQALKDQGTFMVGYHHQRAERFKPSSAADTTPAKDTK